MRLKQIAEGKARLATLAKLLDTTRMSEPSFRMIIVATGDYAYKDPDGTLICPIASLRP